MYRYNFTDLVKLLLAILLVVAHCASEIVRFPPGVDLLLSFYIVVVPFFLCVGSFFLFKKIYRAGNYREQFAIYKAYSLRLLGIYAIWSAIYVVLHVLSWCKSGVTEEEVIHYIHSSIVYSTYHTIWFLPALWVAVSCVFALHIKYKLSLLKVFLLSAVLYLIGVVGYSYSECMPFPVKRVLELYKTVFITWRNGLFNGFVFCVVGAFLAGRKRRCFSITDVLLCLFFGGGFVGEAFLMKHINPVADANFLILLVPFTYFLVKAINQIPLKDSPAYLRMRNLSTLVFLSQRLFITAIPALLPGSALAGMMIDPYIGTGIVLGCVLLFSILLLRASAKWDVLKLMY